MHHALEIQEILLNIFDHRRLLDYWKSPGPDLVALARTCRAFKEPALDVLWKELNSLSPIAQCIPAASHPVSPDVVRLSRALVVLRLLNPPFFCHSSIRLVDYLPGPSGISFRVTHVAFVLYGALRRDFTSHPSKSSRTLLSPGHSSLTSVICVANINLVL